MPKGSVIIVDDKGIVARDMVGVVEALGYHVLAACHTTLDALKKVELHRPDIVLMDIKLNSKMDGIETAEEIMKRHGIPVIYVSAYTDDETLERAKRTQPYGYIIKPFEEKVLEVVLELAFERLRAERNLSEKDRQYKLLAENAAEVIWATDRGGNISYISPSVEEAWGYPPHEVIGMHLDRFIAPEQRKDVQRFFKDNLGKKASNITGPRDIEMKLLHRNGKAFWGKIFFNPIFDDGGELIQYQGNVRDITIERDALQALRIQHENYQSILQKMPDYIYVSDPETFEVLFVNDRLRGSVKDYRDGMKCYELFQGISEPCEFCTNGIILKTGMPHIWDHFNKHIGRHFLNTDQIITWHDGRKVRFETAIDITDQKKIEALLRASEKRYRSFIEQSAYGFFILNKNSEVAYLNDVAKGIYGLEKNAVVKLNLSDLFREPGELERAMKNLKEVAAGRDMPRPGVYTIKRLDGEARTVEIQSFPVWRDEKLEGFHGTVVDITDRVNADRELREKSDFLDSIINNTTDGIFVVDEDVNYVLINPASGRIMGHDPKEWIGKRAGTNTHPDDREMSVETFMKAWHGDPVTCEVRVMASDGKYHLLEIRYSRMEINDTFHILGVVTDITDRKRAETELLESRDMFSGILENKSAGIYRIRVNPMGSWDDPDSPPYTYVYINDRYCDMTGISREVHLADPRATMRIIHPEDFESFARANREANEKCTPFYWEGRIIIGGRNRYFSFESHPGETDGGDILWTGMLLDITNEMEGKQALIASEDKFRSLFENSPEAIVILGKEGIIIECNKATAGLMEKSVEEIIGRRFDELGILDSGQSELYKRTFMNMTKGKDMDRREVELIMKGGQSKWIEAIPSMINRAGEFYGVQMIARDITDRKLAEIEMRKRLLRFDIEHGNVYLSKESSAGQSLDAFRELLMVSNEGLLISRKSRKDFQGKIEYGFNHVKVSETDRENYVKPNYKAIRQLVSNVPRGHVIHIDCIEYLNSWLGAQKITILVQYLKDLAITKGLVVLISIDPNAIPEKELRLIEKESLEILPRQSLTKLPQKLLDILKYIDEMNRKGTLPSYSDISEYFEISKPTSRNRISQLKELGTLNEVQRGRMKLLELTKEGKNYLVV